MNKYHAVKTSFGSRIYDSKKEATRAQELSLMIRAKVISELECQVKYPLEVSGVKIGDYVADFVYTEKGKTIVEDVKSPMTAKLPLYRWKKKHMKAQYNIDILEV